MLFFFFFNSSRKKFNSFPLAVLLVSAFHQSHNHSHSTTTTTTTIFCVGFHLANLPPVISSSNRRFYEFKNENQRKKSLIISRLQVSPRNIKSTSDHKQYVVIEEGKHGENDRSIPLVKDDSPFVNVYSFLSRTFVGLVLMLSTMTFVSNASFAQDVHQVSLESPQISVLEQTTTMSTRHTALTKSRYWDIIRTGSLGEVQDANERLMEHAIGVINAMFYDSSGGVRFNTKDMHDRWKILKVYAKEGVEGVKDLKSVSIKKTSGSENELVMPRMHGERDEFVPQLFLVNGDTVQLQKQHMSSEAKTKVPTFNVPAHAFDSRDNAEHALKWLVSTLDDPYSKYLTREELEAELKVKDDGFLGLGAIVELPWKTPAEREQKTFVLKKSLLLSNTRVANLPRVTAIVPDSPAERSGIVVGDRIAAIGSDKFIGLGREEISKRLDIYRGADNYVGYPELTVAKPVFASMDKTDQLSPDDYGNDFAVPVVNGMDRVLGYKLSRVRLPTTSIEPFNLDYKPVATVVDESQSDKRILVPSAAAAVTETKQILSGGDSIVHWVLLTPETSIFEKYSFDSSSSNTKIGYIRLTRFSRLATIGYTKAVEELEKAGAQSYIIDVRNNYGGVIQESMLTASTLLRDVHAVLCYTLNSRGGFTPHDVEEYVLDEKYPGYFLSNEPKSLTIDQVNRGGQWIPPSSYASIHEQRMSRNYKRPTMNIVSFNHYEHQVNYDPDRIAEEIKRMKSQKKLVILMNEGTASAAEVFVSSLRDNGRTIALIGNKTYGKGLVQHTFPMPDGGGLRLTVAEYLTPALQHVTKIGGAQYSHGQFIGGGIRPDIYCPSTQGIPKNVGADLCVGLAVDALEDASATEMKIAMNLD